MKATWIVLPVVAGVLTVGVGRATSQNALDGPSALPEAPAGVGDTEHLDPALRAAIDRAVAAAARDDVQLRVTSGWRSAQRQRQLFDAAVTKYGSVSKASHFVLPPKESAHVRGQAVDVGPPSGARWLDRNGVRFGLCRRYANESWHFERLASARGSRCPALEAHA